ncbi:MAG TPA: DinB family protein [Candidatus Dormibacteraeota bacterium]
MDDARRRQLIPRYKDGPSTVREALEGMSDAQLDKRPSPGEWTPREIAHHLPDSEMTAAIRLRRLLAEDHPMIAGYDENEFARRLRYQERPIGAALDALEAVRRVTAEVLERMTDADWGREGTHRESGRYSCEMWLEIYAAHAHDHAEQILRSRS